MSSHVIKKKEVKSLSGCCSDYTLAKAQMGTCVSYFTVQVRDDTWFDKICCFPLTYLVKLLALILNDFRLIVKFLVSTFTSFYYFCLLVVFSNLPLLHRLFRAQNETLIHSVMILGMQQMASWRTPEIGSLFPVLKSRG